MKGLLFLVTVINGNSDCNQPETNPERIECRAHFNNLYTECIINCPTADVICSSACSRELDENLLKWSFWFLCLNFNFDYFKTRKKCPCEIGCPNGCPCPEYNCPNFNQTDILILSTLLNPREPIITNAAGLDKRNFSFEFEPDTQVYYGCSLTWKNELFILGGGSELRQISKVEKCSLQRIGSLQQTNGLPLFSQTGSCVNINNEKIYICFVVNNSPECFKAASPTDRYDLVTAQSHYDHSTTRIAASQGNIN